jgi:hypothetical protein
MNKQGSVIILILLIASVVTILIATTMKTVATFYALALERKEYVCQRQALESLAFYGVEIGKKRWQEKKETEYRY